MSKAETSQGRRFIDFRTGEQVAAHVAQVKTVADLKQLESDIKASGTNLTEFITGIDGVWAVDCAGEITTQTHLFVTRKAYEANGLADANKAEFTSVTVLEDGDTLTPEPTVRDIFKSWFLGRLKSFFRGPCIFVCPEPHDLLVSASLVLDPSVAVMDGADVPESAPTGEFIWVCRCLLKALGRGYLPRQTSQWDAIEAVQHALTVREVKGIVIRNAHRLRLRTLNSIANSFSRVKDLHGDGYDYDKHSLAIVFVVPDAKPLYRKTSSNDLPRDMIVKPVTIDPTGALRRIDPSTGELDPLEPPDLFDSSDP